MLLPTWSAPSWALPSNWTVRHGDVTLSASGKRLNIQTAGASAIVDYEQFGIAADEHVHFQFADPNGRILNRVTGGNMSQILGQMTGNGRVFLVNPAGIHIGPSAQLNVGSFIASTLSISNEDFIQGNDRFYQSEQGSGAGIQNEGTIVTSSGGTIALLGSQVVNTGDLNAPEGSVHLAVGDDIQVQFTDHIGATVTVNEPLSQAIEGLGAENDGNSQSAATSSASAISAIANAGRIEARHIEAQARVAETIYQSVVNNTGVMKATTATVTESGVIQLRGASTQQDALVVQDGVLDASATLSGQQGGRITVEGDGVYHAGVSRAVGNVSGGDIAVLGDTVAVTHGATVDTSGDQGGGSVFVGGDWQGQGDMRRATDTLVEQGATLKANATAQGNGGTVVVWSDEATVFEGAIEAKGGEQGGNGGAVEVSGLKTLQFDGFVDTSAPQGQTGTLLLDPTDIEIVNAGWETTNLTTVDQFGDANIGGTDTRIRQTAIENSVANVTLQATDDITFSTSVTMVNDGVGISARAGGDIVINQPITTRGGSLSFTANDAGGTQQGDGSIVINAQLDTTGGGIAGGDVDLDIDGGIGSIFWGADILSNNGDLTFHDETILTQNVSASTQGGDITFGGSVFGYRTLNLDGGGTGAVTFNGTVGGSGYANSVLGANPQIYWRLNESGALPTTADNATGNTAYDGTIEGAVTTGAAGALFGETDTALFFPGNETTAKVILSNVAGMPSTTITSEFWIRTNGSGDGIVSYAIASQNNHYLIFEPNSLNLFRDSSTNLGIDVNDNQWHHVAISWNSAGGQVRGYLDGRLVSSVNNFRTGTTISSNGTLVLGQEQDSVGGGYAANQAMPGTLDEFALYNGIITPAQVKDHYNIGTYGQALNTLTISNAGSVTFNQDVTTHTSADVDMTSQGDITINGNITTQSLDATSVSGSILDGTSGSTTFTTTADTTLSAGQVIGTLSNPLTVSVSGGTLDVDADGAQSGNSVNINGTVTPSNTLQLNTPYPGEVVFNGTVLYAPPAPAPTPTPSPAPTPTPAPADTSSSVVLNALQPAQYVTHTGRSQAALPTLAEIDVALPSLVSPNPQGFVPVSLESAQPNLVPDTPFNRRAALEAFGDGAFRFDWRDIKETVYRLKSTDREVILADTETGAVYATIPVGMGSQEVELHEGTHRAYVPNRLDDTVTVIDTVANTVVATVPVESEPVDVAVSVDGNQVMVACAGANQVVVIDAHSLDLRQRVPTDERPVGVTVHGSHVLVINEGGHSLNIFPLNAQGLGQKKIIQGIGEKPSAMVQIPATPGVEPTQWVIASEASRTLTWIDGATWTVARQQKTVSAPYGLAVSPDHALYVAQRGLAQKSADHSDSSGTPFVAILDGRTGAVRHSVTAQRLKPNLYRFEPDETSGELSPKTPLSPLPALPPVDPIIPAVDTSHRSVSPQQGVLLAQGRVGALLNLEQSHATVWNLETGEQLGQWTVSPDVISVSVEEPASWQGRDEMPQLRYTNAQGETVHVVSVATPPTRQTETLTSNGDKSSEDRQSMRRSHKSRSRSWLKRAWYWLTTPFR